jgi:hypothetical protein
LLAATGEKAERFGDQPKLTKGREATLSEFLRDIMVNSFKERTFKNSRFGTQIKKPVYNWTGNSNMRV